MGWMNRALDFKEGGFVRLPSMVTSRLGRGGKKKGNPVSFKKKKGKSWRDRDERGSCLGSQRGIYFNNRTAVKRKKKRRDVEPEFAGGKENTQWYGTEGDSGKSVTEREPCGGRGKKGKGECERHFSNNVRGKRCEWMTFLHLGPT